MSPKRSNPCRDFRLLIRAFGYLDPLHRNSRHPAIA
jgi:hypothetical protein